MPCEKRKREKEDTGCMLMERGIIESPNTCSSLMDEMKWVVRRIQREMSETWLVVLNTAHASLLYSSIFSPLSSSFFKTL